MKKILTVLMALTLFVPFATWGSVAQPADTYCSGSWRYGSAELRFRQDDNGKVSGTLQMYGAHTFGNSPVPLRDAKIKDGMFSFSADGNGGTIEADLTIRNNSIYGPFSYQGSPYSLSFQCRTH